MYLDLLDDEAMLWEEHEWTWATWYHDCQFFTDFPLRESFASFLYGYYLDY